MTSLLPVAGQNPWDAAFKTLWNVAHNDDGTEIGGTGAAGSAISVLTYGAVGDTKANNNLNLTSGSRTVTGANGFTSADIGKVIVFAYQSTTGQWGWGSTITAVASTSSITIAANAPATKSSCIAFWGTDDTAAFKAALAAAAPTGAYVVAPAKATSYMVTSTLEIPYGTKLIGEGTTTGFYAETVGTKIVAGGGYNWPVVAIGPRLPLTTAAEVFATRLENIEIWCSFLPGVVGVFSNKAQEQSGWRNVGVSFCNHWGIHMSKPLAVEQVNNSFGEGSYIGLNGFTNGCAYNTTTFTGGAPTVASGTNPWDANSNYNNSVTSPAQATGVVTLTDSAFVTGLPSQGAVICCTTSNGNAVTIYYGSKSGATLIDCYTDTIAGASLDTAKAVEYSQIGIYVQSAPAFRGINDYTVNGHNGQTSGIGVRVDGGGGVYSRGHAEKMKYGFMVAQSQTCPGITIDGLQSHDASSASCVDLVHISSTYTANSHGAVTVRAICNAAAYTNTLYDGLTNKTITKAQDTEIGIYSIGSSNVGGGTGGKPVITDISSVPIIGSRGVATMTKAGTPSDSDFPNPVDGLLAVDTTNKLLYFRANSGWHVVDLLAVTTKTADYTLTANDDVIYADAAGGVVTMTLPTAVGISGTQYTVKRKNSGANAVTVATASGSESIDGSTTVSLASQYASITIVSNGANWLKIAGV